PPLFFALHHPPAPPTRFPSTPLFRSRESVALTQLGSGSVCPAILKSNVQRCTTTDREPQVWHRRLAPAPLQESNQCSENCRHTHQLGNVSLLELFERTRRVEPGNRAYASAGQQGRNGRYGESEQV